MSLVNSLCSNFSRNSTNTRAFLSVWQLRELGARCVHWRLYRRLSACRSLRCPSLGSVPCVDSSYSNAFFCFLVLPTLVMHLEPAATAAGDAFLLRRRRELGRPLSLREVYRVCAEIPACRLDDKDDNAAISRQLTSYR